MSVSDEGLFCVQQIKRLQVVYNSLYGKPVAELRSVTCRMGSQSVTCHRHR